MGHDHIRTRLGHCQFPHRSCRSRQTSISLVSPNTRSLPQHQKQMAPIANSASKRNVADEAARSNWIVGYETGAEGSTVTRLKKILWGLRNLTMVGDNAWNNYIRGSAAIMQDAIAEDVLAEVPSELYSQEDNALAEVEEAWLAVGEEARDPAAPDWPGQEIAVANDGSLAAVEQLLDHMSNLATKAQPQQDYRNGSTAMGQAGGGPYALKQSLEAHGITSVTRLRGGGGTDDRRQEDKYRSGGTGSARGKRRMVWEPEAERKRQRRSPQERGDDYFQSAPQGAEEWCRVTEEVAATKEGAGEPRIKGEKRKRRNYERQTRWHLSGSWSASREATTVGSQQGSDSRDGQPPQTSTKWASGGGSQQHCTSREGHRWMPYCRHYPSRCDAACCGQNGCEARVWCDCADHLQGAQDVQRRGLTEAAIERGLVENSWRGTRKDDDEGVQERGGQARGEDEEDLGGWDKVADTFMEDPRWEDYIKAVKCGDNPTLTWRQYVLAQRVSAGLATLLALGYRRPRQLPVVTEQSPTRSPPPAPPVRGVTQVFLVPNPCQTKPEPILSRYFRRKKNRMARGVSPPRHPICCSHGRTAST